MQGWFQYAQISTKTPKHVKKKWQFALNLKSGSNRLDKCRWYELIDEFMGDRADVISHAHNTALKPSEI